MGAIGDVFLDIGAVLGLLVAAYTAYEMLQRPKIELYPANSISLPVSRKGYISKFQLGCNLANKTSKLGAVQRLEIEVINPKHEVYRFRWKLFYEYQPETGEILKESDPYPIIVMPKNSQVLFIEFESADSIPSEEWIIGRYEFNVKGWMNRKDRNSKVNLKSSFHINITEEIHSKLMMEQTVGPPRDGTLSFYRPSFCPIPIEEWDF
ncbi:MAG: hypothetical protein R6X34_26880 [Chloroflexota bacterium]|jgi:hypothetical protein